MTDNLTQGLSVTLDANGNGTVKLGPVSGPANWRVTGIIVQTDRRGQAPIPDIQLFLGETTAAESSIGVGYDGSFGQFVGEQTLARGQFITVQWTGGQAGDVATATVNGEKW